MASENALKERGLQKRCGIILLNVPNFLYIYEKPPFE